MAIGLGSRVGPYEVTALIGEGGMGKVWRAHHAGLKRDDALKVLPDAFASDPDRLARFQREAQVLASLNHPHIAHVYGLERSDGVQALVMELVDGPTLADKLASGSGRKAPGLPLDEVLPIARQIAEALEAAHEQGIIHRDLKPANIKVRDDGAVKVLDFGLAKALEPTAGSGLSALGQPGADQSHAQLSQSPTITSPALMTGAGVLLGTAAYMSPEQARGKPADKRSDLWAFGCVLYEMLTGERAFPGDDITDTLAAIIRAEPDWAALPPHTPAAIRKLLHRCLAKDRKARLDSASGARLEIEEALTAPATDASIAFGSSPRAVVWKLATLAFGIVALALAGWIARDATRAPATAPDTFRFAVSPPVGSRLTTGIGAYSAVSPDGRFIVLPVNDERGQTGLMLRALDDDAPRELPGTTGAQFPFWAPDSRGIAFFANGQLRRTDRDGAPVQTVADVPAGIGGTWAPDGTIIIGTAAGPLRRVQARGGPLTEMSVLDVTTKESSHRHPQMLPDGRHFLYLASTGSTRSSIYAGSLDDNSTTLVVGSDSNAAYVDGYILFTRAGTLLAQPFDPVRLAASGDPVAIARNNWFNPTFARADFSVSDNGTLAFRVASPPAPTQLTWLDRAGRELGKIGEPDDQMDAALSPDGTRAVVSVLDPAQQSRDLWIWDLPKTSRTRVTFGATEDLSPVWSPDGRRLAFSSMRADILDLFARPTDGSGTEELLVASADNKYPASWSRDGRALLFHTGNARSRTGNDVYLLSMEPGAKREPQLRIGGPFNETSGRVSPDGRWIAYGSNELGRFEVYVVPFAGSGGKWQVTDGSSGSGGGARWNPNGRELLFVGPGNTSLMSVAVDGSGTAFKAATPQKLFDARFRVENYRGFGTGSVFDISPDGQRILANLLTAAPTPPDAITVVTNWTSLIRR